MKYPPANESAIVPRGDRDSNVSLPALEQNLKFNSLKRANEKVKSYDKRADPWDKSQTNFNQNNNDIDVLNTETDPYPGNFGSIS